MFIFIILLWMLFFLFFRVLTIVLCFTCQVIIRFLKTFQRIKSREIKVKCGEGGIGEGRGCGGEVSRNKAKSKAFCEVY